jgi:histidinol-phosphate/aromatic aminotransferase/cobyric acid decarboxylase-like protein
MKLSKLASEIAESPTLALNEEARQLRERGEPVIHLGIGEPKNKTPINAILSSAAKLSSGEVKYTPADGTLALKKAIIRYTEENYDRLVAPENVLVTNGAKQSLFNILYSILNPQDEAIILAPYWVSYPEIVKMCNARAVVVTPENGTFIPRFEDIERAVTSYTRAIIVNSPNNPSGAIYPPELIEKLVQFCESKGIFMICDDIYHKLTFDRKEAVPAYRYTKKDIEDSYIVVVNGVAKLYGMTGFRVGWVVAPRALVRVMTNVTVHVRRVACLAGGSGRCLERHAISCRGPAITNREQPQCTLAGNEILQWRTPDPAGWHLLCVARFACLQQRFSRNLEVLTQEGFGCNRAWQGFWHGRPHPPVLQRYGQGCDRRPGAHQVGARPDQPERDLYWRP